MPARDRVVTQVLSTSALSARDWDEVWALTDEFYDVEREYAETELRRRQSIALFRMNGVLLGMACISVFPAMFRGRRIAVLGGGTVAELDGCRLVLVGGRVRQGTPALAGLLS